MTLSLRALGLVCTEVIKLPGLSKSDCKSRFTCLNEPLSKKKKHPYRKLAIMDKKASPFPCYVSFLSVREGPVEGHWVIHSVKNVAKHKTGISFF